MGFAIARAAAEAGAEVTLVAGPVHLATPRGVRRIDVRTAQQMYDAVLPAAPRHDVFVATAAVADWRPATLRRAEDQEERQQGGAELRADREPRHPGRRRARCRTARTASASRPRATTCSSTRARSCERKNVPLIVGNLGPATFGQDDNALMLVDAARRPRAAARRQAHPRARAGRRDRRAPRPPTHDMTHDRPEGARPAHGRAAARLRHAGQRRPRPARLPRRAAGARARARRS